MSTQTYQSDVIIIGAGIAGIVAALELLDGGKSVLVIDRDKESNIGGLAITAFGGMALVDTPQQRKMGVKDSPELALRDWYSFADFEEGDYWPKRWAECYVNRSVSDVQNWLNRKGIGFFPAVNWVERGLYTPGNTVPRYHILWGTAEGMMKSLINQLFNHPQKQKLTCLFEHSVNEFSMQAGRIDGCKGEDEGTNTEFEAYADAVITATGGIGGNIQKVRDNWPKQWKAAPDLILNGSHPYADGRLHEQAKGLGANITHLDKMWNYAAGIPHPKPRFDGHSLSLIPCKSALWLNHKGERIGPDPLVTGFDTNYLCKRVSEQEKPYTWQVMNWKIAAKEFAISGAEHNQMIRDKKFFSFIKESLFGNHRLIRQIAGESDHFIVADNLAELVTKMNQLTDSSDVDYDLIKATIDAYDDNFKRGKAQHNDDQIRRIEHARQWRSDRFRTCKPMPIISSTSGPLIAIKVSLISRKSLGGIKTDLQSRVLCNGDVHIPGLYAVGECAGFGGGGANGLRSLEGTFLAGCILTSRMAAKSILGKDDDYF